tara:strand:- start:298 stop:561 length:264 start_codon:yes stop_codon:yes gene_type:complete
MKISELLQEKVEMCPEACCGVPVTECTCGPECKHCDCHDKNKAMKEMTSASSMASSMGNGNGFVGGGPGTIKRAPGSKKKKTTKRKA